MSASRRDGSPRYIVVPPDRTMLRYKLIRMSMSARWMVSNTMSAMPGASTSATEGVNSASGASNRS